MLELVLGIWISQNEINQLPTSGAAWSNVVSWANMNVSPNISDQNNQGDVVTLAKALVWAKTGVGRDDVIDRCLSAINTENGGRTLALGRNLIGYVLAADIIGWHDPTFVNWVDTVRFEELDGRTLISTHEDRPNNWGTHAGASRIAADLYIGDLDDLEQAALVWKGWCGDLSSYDGHEFSSPFCWHSSGDGQYRGINPAGTAWDGVLPDDQRRSGSCPPNFTCENYVREALQGVLASAIMLERAGYPMSDWEDQAILRAANRWDDEGCDYPSDDEWEPWVINYLYNTNFPATNGATPGKNVGFTDWTLLAKNDCPFDLDNNGSVGTSDMLILLGNWDSYGTADFLALLGSWGDC